jgi:hypothetical protein
MYSFLASAPANLSQDCDWECNRIHHIHGDIFCDQPIVGELMVMVQPEKNIDVELIMVPCP